MSKRKRAPGEDPEDPRPTSALRSDGIHAPGSASVETTFSPPSDDFGQLSNVANFQALQAHNASHGQPASVDGRNGNGTPSTTSATDTAAAALASHYRMSLPQSAESLFQPHSNGHESPNVHTGAQDMSFGFSLDAKIEHPTASQDESIPPQPIMVPTTPSLHPGPSVADSPGLLQTPLSAHSMKEKPAVGTEAWHKLRRDNHKEVERRRRETINEGITELAKIVPGCEKNKGSILQRTVQYISELKDNESQNVEKWTLEKLLTEQAISELSATVDDLKNKLTEAWGEIDRLKSICEKAGVDIHIKDAKVTNR